MKKPNTAFWLLRKSLFYVVLLSAVFYGGAISAGDNARTSVIKKLSIYKKSVADWESSYRSMMSEGQKKEQILASIGDYPDPSSYVTEAKQLFQENPAGSHGFDAIMFYLAYSQDSEGARKKAFDLVLKHHRNHRDILEAFGFLGLPLDENRAALKAVFNDSDHDSVKGKALLLLADLISERASRPMSQEQRKELVSEGRDILGVVAKDYQDIESTDRFGQTFSLGDRAKALSDALGGLLEVVKVADFPAADLQGNSDTLSNYRGKYLLVDFWATWCVPCKQALPGLVTYHKAMAGQAFEIISVSVDDDPDMVLEYQQESQPMPWVNWFVGPDHQVLEQLQIKGYPTYFLIDPDGNILSRSHVFDQVDKQYVKELVKR